ncbi:acetate/propionate family kinase [Kocuria rhizophila]|uniref:acetate/propionate family kinase n=1 Tax=Kocuria rhizophila TaxID=72000 RepID=UPI001EF62954|nr:acetate kinase [Kocuria rhizophila]MCG7424305.1 acetate kinase [Kocuria rhizophila]
MLVLVVNCGSSSIKYQVREVTPEGSEPSAYTSSMPAINENVPLATATAGMAGGEVITKGLIENIGTSDVKDHTQALEILAQRLDEELGGRTIDAAGHRVVHGGERFSAPVLVNNEIIRAIERLAPLAPLHNPAHALGLRAIQKTYPGMPQVCVFDTAFHRSMPEKAWRYAIPDSWYEMDGMRRYGFHGTSHDYVTGKACEFLGIPREQFNAVVAHLGNGASATAIREGRSFDTSMGYTPLAGLVMGTRSGDLDPSVVTAMLERNPEMSAKEMNRILNGESGLQGICGDSDMRVVEQRAESGDERAQLALEMAAYRLAKYIGGYHVAVGGAQALIFTAGIGENSSEFRTLVCDQLGALGIALDPALNEHPEGDVARISAPGSAIEVLVAATDEERAIAEATAALVQERVKH